jgi:hypothetical protein
MIFWMKLRKNKERNHLKREIERVMHEREQVANTQLSKKKEFDDVFDI